MNKWKDAKLSAIHKKGEMTKCRNYEEMALNDIVCKILVILFKKDLTRFNYAFYGF